MHISVYRWQEKRHLIRRKARFPRQETAAGTQVAEYTTVKYWVSTGTQQITIPDLDGRTGIDAQQTLEDLGLKVTVQKEYSDTDDNGYALVDPGYVYSVEPAQALLFRLVLQ